MSFSHVLELFINPRDGWMAIHDRRYSVAGVVHGRILSLVFYLDLIQED